MRNARDRFLGYNKHVDSIAMIQNKNHNDYFGVYFIRLLCRRVQVIEMWRRLLYHVIVNGSITFSYFDNGIEAEKQYAMRHLAKWKRYRHSSSTKNRTEFQRILKWGPKKDI